MSLLSVLLDWAHRPRSRSDATQPVTLLLYFDLLFFDCVPMAFFGRLPAGSCALRWHDHIVHARHNTLRPIEPLST